jgi:hypothetical protein
MAWWGLKRFTSDAEYFAWQRIALSPKDLIQLRKVVDQKHEGGHLDEVAFYDLSAQPQILPVLYSQRYEYYIEVGSRVAACLGDAAHILDFGCGVGILTNSLSASTVHRHRLRSHGREPKVLAWAISGSSVSMSSRTPLRDCMI